MEKNEYEVVVVFFLILNGSSFVCFIVIMGNLIGSEI